MLASRALVLGPAALVAIFLLAGPVFRGCGDSDDPPSDPVPLPRADGGVCVEDDDCPPDGCMLVRCLAGSCMAVAPLTDRDGDGFAPPGDGPVPCGNDCDDDDPDTFVGASERCDGRDNDCNGMIDDGAPRTDSRYEAMAGDPQTVLVGWTGGFLLTEVTAAALWGIPIALDGTVSPAIEIMRLSMGSAFARVAAGAADDGRVMILSITDFGAARWVILQPDAGTTAVVLDMGDLMLPADLMTFEDVEIIPYGGEFAIVYDGLTTTGYVRHVTVDPRVAPVVALALGSGPATSLGFGTDGTHLVVSDGISRVSFFTAAGMLAAEHEVMGGIQSKRPIASGSGHVVVIEPDGFDFNLRRVTMADGVEDSLHPAPFGEATDEIVLGSAGGLVLVSRRGGAGTTVQALLDDLDTFEGSPQTLGRPGDETRRVSFSQSGGAVGIGGSRAMTTTTDVAVLRACD